MIGTEVVRYDIYGNDVAIANKCESNGTPGHIVVSESTKTLLQENFEDFYSFQLKEEMKVDIYDQIVPLYYINAEIEQWE